MEAQMAGGQMPSQEQIANLSQGVPQSSDGAMEQIKQMLYSQMM
jgi:hypothetical protein